MTNNKLPFITIIIPSYNRKELLEKAILSIVNQEREIPFEYEIIVIDDGSRDGTESYIKKYTENPDYHITYRYQENGGVGKARNHGLSLMNEKSDYLIFLDSDDELKPHSIGDSILNWNSFSLKGEYDKIFGLYYLCEDENGKIIGSTPSKNTPSKIKITYKDFLQGALNKELLLIIKSNIFRKNKNFRFSEEYISEGALWSKIWKSIGSNNHYAILLNTIGRLYRTSHTSETRISQTITGDRFRKNAKGNEEILNILGEDLLKEGLTSIYGDISFRIGVNLILCGEEKIGRDYFKKSLKYYKSLKTLAIYILSYFNKKLLLKIYHIYISHL